MKNTVRRRTLERLATKAPGRTTQPHPLPTFLRAHPALLATYLKKDPKPTENPKKTTQHRPQPKTEQNEKQRTCKGNLKKG
jgi:hypothetical protein